MGEYSFLVYYNRQEWNCCLDRLKITDIYYRYEYVYSMASHSGGKPVLIHYGNEQDGFVYALIIQDIADDRKFEGSISKGEYFDAETPYGYGGPIFYGEFNIGEKENKHFKDELESFGNELGLISQFIRFNPLFYNDKSSIIVDKVATFKSTVYIDTSSSDIIMSNLDSQYRRKIRKAKEAGVTISYDKGENVDSFIDLYESTMRLHSADSFYFFNKNYYNYLINEFPNNIIFFYACMHDEIIGASLFLYDGKYMHYHLGGRNTDICNIPFENLLMTEAAIWAAGKDMKGLHIGGGLSDEDSLFQYKKKFNRKGILPFYIGRSIFSEEKYNELMNIRKKIDDSFPVDNGFFVQYRY